MVLTVTIDKLTKFSDAQILGTWPTSEQYDRIIKEDADVYYDGELAITFRKNVCSSTLPADKGGSLTADNFDYWSWASRSLATDQRGHAAGRDIFTNPEIRLTLGQCEFFQLATKGKITDLESALEIVNKDARPSRTTYFINKAESDGLVDLEALAEVNAIVRRKAKFTVQEVADATIVRNTIKLGWFDKWLRTVWAVAPDKTAAAIAGKKRYVTSQPRANRCLSNVLGTIDRSGRVPWGRLTKSTENKYEEFESNKPFYNEINALVAQYHPEKHAILNERFASVKDEKYNLFGTAFTTITVNNNFAVAYHRDGNNAENAVAAIAVMEKGGYAGGEFIFPELRLGFDIREGDVLIGDNQGFIHGMIPFKMETHDAENVMFVFYQRDGIIRLDDQECEMCRKDFMTHSAKNFKQYGTGEPKWAGSFPGMWVSAEWKDFKKEAGLDRCSETNYWGT